MISEVQAEAQNLLNDLSFADSYNCETGALPRAADLLIQVFTELGCSEDGVLETIQLIRNRVNR